MHELAVRTVHAGGDDGASPSGAAPRSRARAARSTVRVWSAARALVVLGERRGLDAWAAMSAPGRAPSAQQRVNTLAHLHRLTGLDFGFGAPRWTPELDAAVERFRAWWAEHRETWTPPTGR